MKKHYGVEGNMFINIQSNAAQLNNMRYGFFYTT